MESSNMKNMVILKNIPSNMIEEAIIVFKKNEKIKQIEFIDKGKKINSTEVETKSRDFILKEAEMLVTDYINKFENKQTTNKYKNIMNKYNKLKKYSIISTVFFVISLILNFI